MSADACDCWQLDIIGGAIITSPEGEETTVGARMVWTMTNDHSVRFLIYLSGHATPVVRVVSPTDPAAFARTTVAAFERLTESSPAV